MKIPEVRTDGHGVKTVTLGCVGDPNERTLLRIHDDVVRFVDRCLSRTRDFAVSNERSS